MNFLPIFQKMVELFLIIILGYFATKVGVMNQQGKQNFSKLVLNVTMPCTILSSVVNSTTLPGTKEILYTLLIALLSYVLLFVIAFLAPKIMGLSKQQKGVAFFALMFGNVGFIGFPVIDAIYGADAVFYASVFNMPFNLLAYSLGVYVLKKDSLAEGANNQSSLSLKKLFLTPALISSIVSILIALLKLNLPALLCEPIGIVGNITTPAALLIIGCTLAEMPVAEMFNNAKAYLVSFFCIIVSPALTLLVFHPFTSGITLKVAVIMAAMPVATAGTMLCVEHKCDEKFMAQITFLTTLLTVVTIPLCAVFMETLGI